MAVVVPLWSLIIAIALICSLAGYVVARLSSGSASTPARRSKPSPDATPTSESSALAAMQADQAALFSILEKLTTTVKRLSSRAGMQDRREAGSRQEPPPVGTSKSELLKHYGMSGKIGPAFAQAQLDIENSQRTN